MLHNYRIIKSKVSVFEKEKKEGEGEISANFNKILFEVDDARENQRNICLCNTLFIATIITMKIVLECHLYIETRLKQAIS